MTPEQYFKFRKQSKLLKEAKYLVKHCKTQTTEKLIKLVAFKQKAGVFPKDYIKRHSHTWKD